MRQYFNNHSSPVPTFGFVAVLVLHSHCGPQRQLGQLLGVLGPPLLHAAVALGQRQLALLLQQQPLPGGLVVAGVDRQVVP